jgi:hypothetical protein
MHCCDVAQGTPCSKIELYAIISPIKSSFPLLVLQTEKRGVELEFTEENIAEYAKKIMGFAFKNENPTQAQDLSQVIMLALTKALRRQKVVTDLDGFVFKISQYTLNPRYGSVTSFTIC